MHIISTDPIFLCNVTYWNNHPSVYSLWKVDDEDDGDGGGDEMYVCILFQAVTEVSYETLQVLPT